MSRNITFVLVYHRHKLLDLNILSCTIPVYILNSYSFTIRLSSYYPLMNAYVFQDVFSLQGFTPKFSMYF
jgi:hypothetical protein